MSVSGCPVHIARTAQESQGFNDREAVWSEVAEEISTAKGPVGGTAGTGSSNQPLFGHQVARSPVAEPEQVKRLLVPATRCHGNGTERGREQTGPERGPEITADEGPVGIGSEWENPQVGVYTSDEGRLTADRRLTANSWSLEMVSTLTTQTAQSY